MKRINHVAIWGAAAVTFSMLTLPLSAAQDENATPGRKYGSRSDKTFGHVERANKLIGKAVLGSDNQKLGKIDDFVVDLTSGHILYAIIGSGGVLGAGEKRYALPPGIFTEAEGNNVHINVDKAKFNEAPVFTKEMDKDFDLSKAAYVSQVYDHFGQSAWWKGATPANEGSFNNVHKVSDLIGMKVKNVGDQPAGKVENAGLDLTAGRVVFVILQPDSSFNLGNNYYALPPDAFTLSTDHKMLTSDISKEKLSTAPHFAKDEWQRMSDREFASQVYKFYGKQAWFETGGSLRPTGRDLKKN